MEQFFKRGTSNQIWCEYIVQPQAYSEHVGEFWNTASCIVYPICSAFGVWWAINHGHSWPFVYCAVMLGIVGAGSAAFHATQSYGGEMLDEIPMAVMGLGYMWCTFDMHSLTSKPYRVPTFMLFHAIVFAAWAWYLLFHNYEIFQLTFVFEIVVPALIALTSGPTSIFSSTRLTWWLFLVFVGVGRIAWDYERWLQNNKKCPASEKDVRFWLHSIWHLCGALAQQCWMSYTGALQLAVQKSKRE